MKKSLLLVVIIVAIIICSVITYLFMHNNTTEEQVTPNYILKSDLTENKYEFHGEIDYLFQYDDKDAIAEHSDYVIIGKVMTIDKQCWDTEQNRTITTGTIKVKKVFKGNLKGKEISFIRGGGIITLSEFENSLDKRSRIQLVNLTKEERVKWYGLDKFSQNEKDSTYIFDSSLGDIPVESNKTYLMYLDYNSNSGNYELLYKQYGLREVDTSNIILNYDNVKVKDNTTGNYVNLSTAISSKLRKKNLFEQLFLEIFNNYIPLLYQKLNLY